MTIINPIGLVYQINDRFNGEDAVEWSSRARHETVTVLDDMPTAVRLKTEARVPYAIFRDTTWEPGDLRGAGQIAIEAAAVAALAHLQNLSDRAGTALHFLVNNEQEWTKERFQFYVALLDRTAKSSSKDLIGLVFGNFASGSVKSGQGDDANWWDTDAREFLLLLDSLSHRVLLDGTHAYILGVHEYTSLYPWIASNGGEFLVSDWFARSIQIDWNKSQWHIGRTLQGIRRAGLPVPWMIITETLFDRMNDIIQAWVARFGGVTGTSDPRGYKSLEGFWRQTGFFPGTVGETYHEFLVWTWDNIWSNSDRILGVNVYMANGTGNWDSFDVARNKDFQNMNEAFSVPAPTDINCRGSYVQKKIVSVDGVNINYRRQPTTASTPVLGSLPSGTEVALNLDRKVPDPVTANWFWYEIGTVDGGCAWVSDRGGKVRFEDIPLEEEPEEETPIEEDIVKAIEALSARINAIGDRLTVIEQSNFLKYADYQNFAQLQMDWTALNFVSKPAFQAFLKALPAVAATQTNLQNVESDDGIE